MDLNANSSANPTNSVMITDNNNMFLNSRFSIRAGFCNIFGGDYTNMAVAMASTFIGLFVLQEAHKKNFNIYFRVVLASFIASVFAAFGVLFELGKSPDIALATSILFLVPGVPMINSFTDFFHSWIRFP